MKPNTKKTAKPLYNESGMIALSVLNILLKRSPSKETTKFLNAERDELLDDLGLPSGYQTVSMLDFMKISE